MRKIIKKFKIGNVSIEHQKWHQGQLSEHMVLVYQDKTCIFDEDDLNSSKATKLYKEKIKEYEIIGCLNYQIHIKNDSKQWVEKYTIIANIEPLDYFTKMIENFNNALRPREKLRIFIKFEEVKE